MGSGTTDAFGSFLFRDLDQGAKYFVSVAGGAATPVTVLRFEDNPDASFYQAQSLHAGLQYIQARDGTLLAAMVRAPLGKTLDQGPFPTVVATVSRTGGRHCRPSSPCASP